MQEVIGLSHVNLVAPSLLAQLAARLMAYPGPPCYIVNILSVWAWATPSRESNHFYSATKRALLAVSDCLRRELAARNSNIR